MIDKYEERIEDLERLIGSHKHEAKFENPLAGELKSSVFKIDDENLKRLEILISQMKLIISRMHNYSDLEAAILIYRQFFERQYS